MAVGVGARLQETLGQPFLVENRAGGDGYIGFDAVARADADGSTLLYSPGSSVMIAPHVVNRPDLDPLKALVPVAATGAVSLYVSGAEDKLGGPPELMENLSRQVKGARHISVPRAAHIANIQNPEGFNKVLGEFLK